MSKTSRRRLLGKWSESLEGFCDLLNILCAFFLLLSFCAWSQSTVIIAPSSQELPQHTTITATVTQNASCTTAGTTTQCSYYVYPFQPIGVNERLGGKVTIYYYVVLAEGTKNLAGTLGYVGLVAGLVGIPVKAYFWWRRNGKRIKALWSKIVAFSQLILHIVAKRSLTA